MKVAVVGSGVAGLSATWVRSSTLLVFLNALNKLNRFLCSF